MKRFLKVDTGAYVHKNTIYGVFVNKKYVRGGGFYSRAEYVYSVVMYHSDHGSMNCNHKTNCYKTDRSTNQIDMLYTDVSPNYESIGTAIDVCERFIKEFDDIEYLDDFYNSVTY